MNDELEKWLENLIRIGYTEEEVAEFEEEGLTKKRYDELLEEKETSTEKINGKVRFKFVNHSERAANFERTSEERNIAVEMNVALKYFGNRCALSGEEFVSFGRGKVLNSKAKTNLSAEHVVALCQGGDDVIPNLVPTVLQYNISKNGYYLLDWWKKQTDNEGKTIYSPYRLLKLVNFIMKSIETREKGIDNIKDYEKAILEANEIDKFLEEIEKNDKEEQDNRKRKIISSVETATTIDEDGKKILTKIPEIEGNIPRQSEQQREKYDDIKMMDIFLADAITILKEDEELRKEPDFEILTPKLDTMYEKIVGTMPFEVEVRNKILNKLKEIGVEKNIYTISNEVLRNSDILRNVKGNKDGIEEYITKYFNEKEKQLIDRLQLTDEQIKVAISNIPDILYDENVIKKIEFYKEKRPNHLQDYLEGKNTATDEFIDKIIILQKLGVDTNQLVVKDTIKSLAEKSGIEERKLIEAGLNPTDKIGRSRERIASAYRGKRNYTTPNQKQVEEMKKLGIRLEKIERDVNEEFIDTIRKLQELGVDTNQLVVKDTIKSLAEKSGIAESKLKEAGLNPTDKIGSSRDRIASAYRADKDGNKVKQTPPTQEQVKEMERLGIRLEKIERDVNEEFIDTIKKLQDLGVDTNQIKKGDTIKSLAEKSGIEERKLKEVGLNPTDKIENSKSTIASAYRANKEGKKAGQTPPTQEQVKEMERLGIRLEIRDVNEEFIDTIKKLQELGVDTNKLINDDTIKSLAEKSRIDESKLKEAGLNPTDKIGGSRERIASAYRADKDGNKVKQTPPTQEQVKEMERLGIRLEIRDVNEEFIDTIKRLQELGVDTNKLVDRDTIKSLAEKSGIEESKLIEVGLNPIDNIGRSRSNIASAYRANKEGKKSKSISPTPEQVEEMQRLGISLEKVSKGKLKQIVVEQKEKTSLGENVEVGNVFEETIKEAERISKKEEQER